MCITRSIERERKILPMSQAKVKISSTMQLQEGSKVHPFYSTLMKYGNDEVPVNCVTNCEWDVIE